MKVKKAIAAAASLCIASASFIPAAHSGLSAVPVLSASAEDGTHSLSEMSEVSFIPYQKQNGLTFNVYSDRVIATGGDKDIMKQYPGDIRIPPDIGGIPVIRICEGAFEGNDHITSVIIPEGVAEIGYFAFDNCYKLTDVSLPSSLRIIGKDAFCGCAGLEAMIIPDGVTDIGVEAFLDCFNLKEVSIPASVTTIGRDVFGLCEMLTDIYYGGTEEQWEALKEVSHPEDNDEMFEKAIVHYGADSAGKVMYGDANEDGKITVADAVAALQYIANAEKYPLTETGAVNADCDGEKGITGGDAIMIQKYDSGVTDTFPAEGK
ncbi:MAG: leucine-rich repeat protein [Ruminococcus sp.]|nr:leucine-rich repeat protein [Ruminococcus sp.]